jgi:hypothetical protein
MPHPAAVVRRYFAVVADLGSSREALLELLHPDARVVERPNALTRRVRAPRSSRKARHASSPGGAISPCSLATTASGARCATARS